MFRRGSQAADLRDLIRAARAGLRSSVQPLCDALANAPLMWPLHAPPPDREERIRPMLDNVFLIEAEETRALALFSTTAAADVGTAALGWTTAGPAPALYEMPARQAFRLALEFLASGVLGAGRVDDNERTLLVIDPLTDSHLELTPFEVASLATGAVVPLRRYVDRSGRGADSGETLLVGEPAQKPPATLRRALERFAARHGVERYEIKQLFNPERDIEPHLHVNLWTRDPGAPADQLVRDLLEELESAAPSSGTTASANVRF